VGFLTTHLVDLTWPKKVTKQALNPKKNAGLQPIGIGATSALGIGKLYAAVAPVFQCKTRSSRA